jgi:hypothetical protein
MLTRTRRSEINANVETWEAVLPDLQAALDEINIKYLASLLIAHQFKAECRAVAMILGVDPEQITELGHYTGGYKPDTILVTLANGRTIEHELTAAEKKWATYYLLGEALSVKYSWPEATKRGNK